MNNYYILLLCLLSGVSAPVFSQCPPPGFPDAGNTCIQAPILCENLDGYCNEINNNNTPQNFPGCPGWQLNNDEWFAFFAGTTSITIQVTPSNCSQGPQMGLQAGIYAGCGPPWQPMDLQCSCTQNPFILESNNFVIGQVYYFVIDGCSGNICDYSIDVLSGSTVGVPPGDPGAITGPTPVCAPSTTQYSTPQVTGATIYTWTLTPASAGTITGQGTRNITINWAANYSGPVELCVQVSNLCYSNPTESCITIEVIPRPTATLSGSGIICFGDPEPVDLSVAFTGEGPWTFVYAINGAAQAPITTSDNPYVFQVTQPGNYSLVSVTTEVGNCIGTVSGSAQIIEIKITSQVTVTNEQCGTGNGAINLGVGGGNPPYMFEWSNGATTEDLSNLSAGDYTVTITDNNGCTHTQTATVLDNLIAITINGNVQANTTCMGGNGTITTNVAPQGTYEYDWSNGATTPNLTNLEPGTYTLTVTSGVTCTATAEFTIDDNPNEPIVSGVPTPTTCDQSNGAINLNVSGGVTPYTFLWSNGSTSEDLANIPAGSYEVTVTGANGCTGTAEITVDNNNPPFNVGGNVVSNTTCNGGNGSITLSVSPQGNYTYLWSTGATTPNLTDLVAGTYTVTVSAGGSCTETAEFTIDDEPNEPNLNLTAIESTCDLSNGGVNLSVSGGVAPYTFLWSNGATTQNLANVLAGNYAVTVTGANGCTSTAEIDVENNNPTLNIDGNIVANTTCNGGNGSITISVSPQGNYTYLWSNGGTTTTISNLPPGDYTVTVSGGGSCTETAEFNVPDEPNQPDPNLNTIESTCDLSNGSVNLSVSGGVAPYTYLWSNGATSQNLANVPAGNYAVTVTGANGCTNTAEIDVENNNPPITIDGNVLSNTTCIGGNGSITLAISPQGNYTFLWSNGATTTTINNLAPGDYTVTVNGGGSCTETAEFNVPDEPNTPNIFANPIASVCELNNGGINLSVSGGVPAYTFLWSNGATSQNLVNIPTGSYGVTVTGANGCSSTEDIFVDNDNPPITIDGNVLSNTTCIGGNGSITLFVSPPGAYTYLWSTGATTPNLANLPPGDYTVTVNGGGACIETTEFNVPDEPNAPNLFANPTESTCELSNGAINLSVSGGVPAYTYLWSNGATSQNLINLATGNYGVTVTGANGCSTTEDIYVDNNNPPIDIDANINPSTACVGGNGSIVLFVSPPNPAYTYLWSTGATTLSINNLPTGLYEVTVSAGGACTQVASFTVPDDPFLPDLGFSQVDASCGLSNGSINLTVFGGAQPFTYQWSSGQFTQDLNNIPAGIYAVVVTGANGCTNTDAVEITNEDVPISLDGFVNDKTSCVQNNGSISLNYSPFNLTVSWSNGSNQPNLNNLAPGTYTVTVSAGGTCTETAEFTVSDISEQPNVFAEITPATCGFANGGILLDVFDGIPPYTYNWSNNIKTQNLSNLAAGNYAVTVTTAVGCTAVLFVVVPAETIDIEITGVVSDNVSCTTPNGYIDIDLFPTANFGYLWSNGRTTQDNYDIPAGVYTVTVTLGVGCSAVASFDVFDNTNPPNLSTSTMPAICGQPNGSASVSASGGSMPYTYLWSAGGNTPTINNLPPGTYTVTVTDFFSCSATATATVVNSTIAVNITGTPTPNTSCSVANGAIDISVTPAVPYTYVWSNSANTQDLVNLPAATYTVTVSAGVGCTATASFAVTNNTIDPVLAPAVTPSICGLSNGAIDLSVSSGTAPYIYSWSNMANTQDLNNILAGVFTVTVTDANGCTAISTSTVPNNASTFSLLGTTTALTNCIAANGSIDLTVTPAGGYTYIWSNGATSQDIGNLPAGTFTVSVTELGDCTASATFIVADGLTFPTLNQSITPELCGLTDGAINLAVSGGAAPFTFNWASGQNTEDLNGIPAGDYAVTVTGNNGCTATSTSTVPANSINFSIAGLPTANTSCVVNNGAINLTLNPADPGGGPGYTYVWSNAFTTEDLSGLTPGVYTVTVSAGGICTSTASYNVNNNAFPPTISENVGAALCGQSSGFVNLTISGGASPYTFIWSNTAQTEDLNGLVSGTYTVTVTGANGCTATKTFTVQENVVTPDISGIPTPNTSCVSSNGSINLSVLPTTLAYTYIWSGGQMTANISNLAPGDYTVTVNGGGSCTNTETFTVGNNTEAPQIADVVSAALCGQSSGSIDLTVSSGISPYTFQWSNNATIEDLNGVLSGNYSVVVTGANGCTSAAAYVVPEDVVIPDVAGTVTPVSSCIVSNGSIDLAVTPATLTYTYVWSGSQPPTSTIADLPVGSYTVTVNGGGACIATATFVVPSSTGTVMIGGTPANVLCFGQNTGALDLNVGGGAAPYTFNWAPGIPGNPEDPANLIAGTYSVTATDAAGCTAISTFTVTQPATAVQLACAPTNEVSFPGAGDGSAALTISGGTAPYSITWSPGSTQTSVPAGVFPINNLNEGSYSATVTDANGCTTVCGFIIKIITCETKLGIMQGNTLSLCGEGCITSNYNPIGEFLEPGDVLQFILHEGSGTQIVNEIERSTEPTFCFDPTAMAYGTTYYISAAAGNNDGTGNVLLTHYCTVVSAGTPIVFQQKPVATATQPGPLNCAVSQVAIAGTSDIPGSTFQWSTVGGQIIGSPAQPNIGAGAAGLYTLIIGANGCADTVAVPVQDLTNQPQATIVANPNGILDCGITEIILTGGVEGTSDANSVWFYNGNTYAVGSVLMINAPGNYQFVILDTLTHCSDTALIQIQENLNFPPLFTNTPATLNCVNNGVTLSGGSSFPDVQFTWALVNGTDTTIVGTGTSVSVSTPGNYILIGLDQASQCTNEIGVTVVSDIVYPSADAGLPFSIYCFGETASLDGTGSSGLPGLAYLWTTSGGTIVSGANMPTPTISQPGTYTLVVTNPGNGCTDSADVVIDPDDPIATAIAKHPPCEGDRGAIVIDTVIGGEPPLRYSLNGGTPTSSNLFSNLGPGDYTVFVVDANGCSTEVDVTIDSPQILEIILDTEVTMKLGDSILIEAEVNLPASALAQIQWTPATYLSCDTCLITVASPLISSRYYLTVVSTAGCRDNASLIVVVDRRPNVYIPNVFNPEVDGENSIFRIYADQTVKRVKTFEVFSRWGERVYEYYNFDPNSPAYGWDGRFNGQPMNPAVFAYYAIIELVDGQEILYEGDVTLVR